ncbi:ABC transporter G family member 1-like isoform X2 [Amaranthus tricolor]|uniref:ABC transporter G family member 1-like isoform X2 n=1 Tax=Amaranthus tricolor TaxID=29722 RepID=UPI00258A8BEE|nr:ABC transporter G family member 1-like isoform X2 [Amaranthus tricolor]
MASDGQHDISVLEVDNASIEFQQDTPWAIRDHNVGEDGVCLTWQELCVTVSDKEAKTSKTILENVTGYSCPGQVLAIMGPSGSGKSTLLDALAGRLDLNTKQSGQILINGTEQALAYGTSAYVTQDDVLMTTLTVKEIVNYSSLLQLPSSMSKLEKRKRADECIKEMGLQDSIHTRVGGWGVKGLSGGQKRRLSICIEILTHPKLLFLDEPTSGLDSAASFYVMSRIAGNQRAIGRTIITSIHQPSTQVFHLFGYLCLLSAGKTIYFGPAQQAIEDIEQGLSTRKSTDEVINILVNSYKSSESYEQVQEVIYGICNNLKGSRLEKGRKRASFITQCQVLTRRSFINMCRDWGYYWLRLAIYIILGVGLGTLFFNIGFSHSSIQARGSLIMFVASYLTFMTIGGFPSFIEDMKVFKRERLNGHYGVTSYVVGNTLSSTPFLLMIAIIPGAIIYFLSELQREYQHFLYYLLLIFVCMLLIESLMMIIASLVPNFLMGIITGAGVQGIMMLSGGFFRLPNDLPNIFWRYPFYYISFHKYAFQGLFKNEFEGLEFPRNDRIGARMISGTRILKNVWQVEDGYSKWVDLLVLVGMVIVYRLLFLFFIKSSEKIKPLIKSFVRRAPKQVVQVDCS